MLQLRAKALVENFQISGEFPYFIRRDSLIECGALAFIIKLFLNRESESLSAQLNHLEVSIRL